MPSIGDNLSRHAASYSGLSIHGDNITILTGADAGKPFVGGISQPSEKDLESLVGNDVRFSYVLWFPLNSYPVLDIGYRLKDSEGNVYSVTSVLPDDNAKHFAILLLTAKDK